MTQMPPNIMILTSRPSKTRRSLIGSQHIHNNISQSSHRPKRGLLRGLDKFLGQILPPPYTPLLTIQRPTTAHFHPCTPSITSNMHRPLPNIRSPLHSSAKQRYANHIPRISIPQWSQSHHTHTPTTSTPTLHNKHHMRTRPTNIHPIPILNPTTLASPMVGGNARSNRTNHL